MIDAVVDMVLSSIARYGLIVLFIVFIFEGAIVGKLLPTRTLFVAALLLVGGGVIDYLSVYVVAVAGATIGQVALFGVLRHYDLRFSRIRWVPVKPQQVDRAAYWFDEWGLPAVAISNVLPIMRGSMTVPVAMSNASPTGFALASGVGSIVYVGALVAIASGIHALFI